MYQHQYKVWVISSQTDFHISNYKRFPFMSRL